MQLRHASFCQLSCNHDYDIMAEQCNTAVNIHLLRCAMHVASQAASLPLFFGDSVCAPDVAVSIVAVEL